MTVATGTLAQLAKTNKDITAELKEQIALTKQAAANVQQGGNAQGYFAPPTRQRSVAMQISNLPQGRLAPIPMPETVDAMGVKGIRGTAKMAKFGSKIMEKGIDALANPKGFKEAARILGVEAVTETVTRLFPAALAAYMVGNLIAEKIVDKIIGSTKEEVEKIIKDGERITRQNSLKIDVGARGMAKTVAEDKARREAWRMAGTLDKATYNMSDAIREDIGKRSEENLKKLEELMAKTTDQGDRALIGANIGSRTAIIRQLQNEGKKATETQIKEALQKLVLMNEAQLKVFFAKQEERQKDIEKDMQARIDENPSLPCILKQQQAYFRHVEEQQNNNRMAWSSF